jgi:hypothetical protein
VTTSPFSAREPVGLLADTAALRRYLVDADRDEEV